MNYPNSDKQKINDLVLELKEKEINQLRQKIVALTQEVNLHPQEKMFSVNLNLALLRLEQLLKL